jgi:uncharacterized protein
VDVGISTRFVKSAGAALVAAFVLLFAGTAQAQNLTVTDVSLNEGNAGTTTFTFTVSLDTPAGPSGVFFDIATANGTATDASLDYTANSLVTQNIPVGVSDYTFDVLVNGDVTGEPHETFFVNVTNVIGATVTDGQGQGTIVDDDMPLTPIHDIQGPGALSPIIGATVKTRGIVTGVTPDGFFMQEPDATVDADPATSEGIFVFTSSAPPVAAAFEAQVEVTATVAEFVPPGDPLQPAVTRLTSPSVVQLLPPVQPLPAAIPLTSTFPDPNGPFDQLERVEGMRVSVASLTVTGPTNGSVDEVNATSTSQSLFHGVITGVARPFREAGIQAPDPAPGGSTIPPIPRWDANPERIAVDSDGIVGQSILNVKSGDVVASIVGPLDYSLRGYTIFPTTAPIDTPGTLPTTVTAAAGTEFTVASINLRRLFDDIDDPSLPEPVLTAPAYAGRLAKASLAIRTHLLNPDIIGVQEVENFTTLQALAARIATDGGPSYDAYLVDGNDAVDGLDVGFLVKTEVVTGGVPRVSVDSLTQINAGELFVNPDSSTALLNDRPPLVLEATVNRTSTQSFPIVVVVSDLLGLSGIDDIGAGSNGWTTAGERVRQKRLKQAESLANYIQTRQTNDPAEHLTVIGSFNAFEVNDGYVDTMNVVAGTPPPDNQTAVAGDGVDLVNPDLVNLFSTAPAAQRYSDVFLGSARNVDHVLAGAALVADTAARRIEHPRIAADYADVAMNNTGTALRFSDRDPVVAYFTVNSFTVADVLVTKVDTPDPVIAGQQLTYTITVTNNGPDAASTVSLADTMPPGTLFAGLNAPGGWSCITPAVGSAGETLTCSNASMSVGSAVFTLTVNVLPSVAAGGTIMNTATVTAATTDTNPGNESATATTTVATSANLSTLVADSPDPVPAGQNVTYTVTIANSGPSDASTVTLTNPVGGNATFVSSSVVLGTAWATSAPAVGATGNVVFSKSGMSLTETAIFEIVVRIDPSTPGGTIHTNTATVASVTPDPAPGTNSVSATTTVDGKPTISDITNQVIDEDSATAALPFTIGDVETAAASLTVSASSSDQTLVPDANIVIGGTGANRTITVTPAANRNGGPAIITVTVRDGLLSTTSDTFAVTVTAVNDDPTIGTITDQSSNANATVGPLAFTVGDIDNDAADLTLSATSSNQALVANAGITFGGSGANRTISITPLTDQSGQTTITVTVNDGAATASTSFVLTVTPPTEPTTLTYYLAEGATGSFFDEDLTIANPNTSPADVTIKFLREGATDVVETRTIAAKGGITLNVDSLLGLEATAAAVQVTSEDGLPLAVERTQYWGEGSYGGHTENAVPALATRWYFAEGSQGWFDTFVLIGNPQADPVDVTLTFLREGDTTVTQTVQVAPFSRKTISAATIPDLVNRSFGIIVDASLPVVSERAMYFGSTPTRPWSGGGDAAGTTTPSTDWYFAEGATGSFFDTFILMMNPDANNDAHITLRYLLDTGETIDVPKVIPASGRLTVNIEAEDDARLHNATMSARITSDRPIVAERAVYWPTGEGVQPWGESHVTQGVTAAGSRWALAEGRTGTALNFHTYILLGNPSAQAAEVTVEFLPRSGSPVVKTYNVAAGSRFTIDATFEAPTIQNAAFITLISTAGGVPIVVERSLYWDGAGITWSGGSSAVATRLPEPPE